MAKIITPNIPEAEILLGKKIAAQEDLPQYAKELSKIGNVSVLLKAGHLTDRKLIDVFYDADSEEIIACCKSKRLYQPSD